MQSYAFIAVGVGSVVWKSAGRGLIGAEHKFDALTWIPYRTCVTKSICFIFDVSVLMGLGNELAKP